MPRRTIANYEIAIVNRGSFRAVRRRFSEAVVHVDCNSAYTLADVDMFRALD